MHASHTEDFEPPGVDELLHRLGDRIRLARKRRSLREQDLAELAGVSRYTLRRIEGGNRGTRMSSYAAVIRALHLQHDFNRVAHPDRDPYPGLDEAVARRIRRVRRPAPLPLHDDLDDDDGRPPPWRID